MATIEDKEPSSGPVSEQVEESPSNDGAIEASESELVKGWRLYMLTLGIWIALFLSTLETTIVSTCLVAISDSLSGFERRNWIVTSYLLTYTGFLVIYAKMSSIFGKKTLFLVALVIFTSFSLACGAVNSMIPLIVLRAFQGMGASGIYSMTLVVAPTLVPREEYGKYIGIVSSVFALASVVGPVIGGAIATHTSWRWVFLLNGPAGVVAIVLIAIFLPASKVAGPTSFRTRIGNKFLSRSLRRIDIPGVGLLLAASVLLVFALESGGTQYTWHSPAIISTLILSGLAWIAWVVWEVRLEKVDTTQEPIFPMALMKNRIICSMMATTLFIGFPFVAILFSIPQRAQAVNGLSPIKAAWALLPLLLTSPFATVLGGVLTSTFNVPPAYLIVLGTMIQVIGVGLTISVPFHPSGIPAQQYGYEAVMGVGFGLSLSTVLTLADLVASKKEVGVLMGALTQVRVLGGTIALAICSSLLSNLLKTRLLGVISPAEFLKISDTLSSIESLDSVQKLAVKRAFADGYNLQMKVLTAFSGIAFLSSLFLWERTPRTVKNISSKIDNEDAKN